MKRKEIFPIFLVAILILIAPTIFATDTEIVVKTVPFGNVNINILDPNSDSFTMLKNFNKDADNYGDVSFVFSSDKPKFDLTIYVKKNNKKVADNRSEDNVAGEDLYFEVVPEGFELLHRPAEESNEILVDNETVVNDTSIGEIAEPEEISEEPKEETSPGITGSATSGEQGSFFSNKIFYYVLGVLVLSAVFFMGILTARRKATKNKEIKVRKLSDFQKEKTEGKEKKEKVSDYKQAIEDAEKKIEEAQKEIKKLKNVDKISEIKKRMIEDQKELMKLREGEE